MLIKHIRDLHLNDIRNMTVYFENEYDFIIRICGYDSLKLFHFIKQLDKLNKENWNDNTKKVCIPMKNSHSSLDEFIKITSDLRDVINTKYGVDRELKLKLDK